MSTFRAQYETVFKRGRVDRFALRESTAAALVASCFRGLAAGSFSLSSSCDETPAAAVVVACVAPKRIALAAASSSLICSWSDAVRVFISSSSVLCSSTRSSSSLAWSSARLRSTRALTEASCSCSCMFASASRFSKASAACVRRLANPLSIPTFHSSNSPSYCSQTAFRRSS